jgi:hypothetical protein
MRKRNLIGTLVAGGLALATTNLTAASAEQGFAPKSQPQSGDPAQSAKEAAPAAAASNLKASQIIGQTVRNDSGERLGKVHDLIVNLEARSTPFAIIEYGGRLGIGATHVAVPMTDLMWSGEPRQLILRATRQEFESASSIPTGGWMAVSGEDWLKVVDRFYGQPSTVSQSRHERQRTFGAVEGREPVPRPAEDKAAAGLLDPPPGANLGSPGAAKPADKDLMGRVKGLIHQEVGDGANDVQATIDHGVVTLKGKVATDAQKKALETEIMALPGVELVQDDQMTVHE